MLIPVQLFFIGQIVFFAQESLTRPPKGYRRRQADSPANTKLTRNVIPIIPSDYDIPELQFIHNKELLYPTNVDSQGNLVLLPQNRHTEAKRNDEILANLKGFRGFPDLIGKEKKILQRDQRKQPKPEEMEPCGHFQKNDYNMLTNIIGKMSPEARNALIDALLKTLMEKSKVSAVKSGDSKFSHPLDAALQPPLRVNQKPDGPLVQPFSLTLEREKLRDLYKYLNNEKLRSGLKKTDVMINLGELLQESIKKECITTKRLPCCHKQKITKLPEVEGTNVEITTQMHEEAENPEDMCNYSDQYSDPLPSGIMDFPGERVINLTQIFNVHPKLLVVNTGPLAPTDVASLLNETAKTESQIPTAATTTCTTSMTTTTTTTTQASQPTAPIQPTTPVATVATLQTPAPNSLHHFPTKSANYHRKCTRRQFCRHGYRYRYDRRGHISPINDLVYSYYVDMDDTPTMDD